MLDKMAEGHICADIQPPFLATDYPIVHSRTGSRGKGGYAWKSIMDKKIPAAGGSDSPVESFDPIWGIHCAVNRTDKNGMPAGGWHPEEKLTAEEALWLYTFGGAYIGMEENIKGTLEPGKYADMAVLDHDILSVPPEEIQNIRNVMTIMDGKITYRSGKPE